MEVALILYLCSAVQQTCMEPYIWPDKFYDKYGCMIEGYKESEKKNYIDGDFEDIEDDHDKKI